MIIKDGVQLAGLDIRMRPVLIEADKIWRRYGQELVVTAGLDGTHSAGSLHYYGLALDFRTRYFTLQEKDVVFAELKESLSVEYDIIKETTHIHVEYDKG